MRISWQIFRTPGERHGRVARARRLAAMAAIAVLWPGCGGAQTSEQELVANLSAGRVYIYVTHDAILVGAVQQNVEPGSNPPLIFPASSGYLAVLLGAADWMYPASGRRAVDLERVLPRIVLAGTAPQDRNEPERASDLETIGIGFLEKLQPVVGRLHAKLDLGDDPLVELLLVDYHPGYGPEVWSLKYRVEQRYVEENYYQTRVLRPSYTQLYPPEKHQPRTLIEVRYPARNEGPTLAALLEARDPRLERVRNSDPTMAHVAEDIEKGHSQGSRAAEAIPFLRAALEAVAPPKATVVLGVLYEQGRFDWVVEPKEKPRRAEEGKPKEPGRPTLRRPHNRD